MTFPIRMRMMTVKLVCKFFKDCWDCIVESIVGDIAEFEYRARKLKDGEY